MTTQSVFKPRSLSGLIEANFSSIDIASQDAEGKEHIKIDGQFLHTDQIKELEDAENQFFVNAEHHLHRMKDVWYVDPNTQIPYPDDGIDREPGNDEILIYDNAAVHPASSHVGYWKNSSNARITQIDIHTLGKNDNSPNQHIDVLDPLDMRGDGATSNHIEYIGWAGIQDDNFADKTTVRMFLDNYNNTNAGLGNPTGTGTAIDFVGYSVANPNANIMASITAEHKVTTDVNEHETDLVFTISGHEEIRISENQTDIHNLHLTNPTINTDLNMNNNKIINLADPTNGGDAVNKQFFDLQTLKGAMTKKNADLATTGNIALTAEQTIDGVLTATSRVLVKDQTNKTENGIYDTQAGAWTRSDDLDNAPSAEIYNGVWLFVNGGTVNTGFAYRISSQGTGLNDLHTVGVDSIEWDLSNINFTVQAPITKTADLIGLDHNTTNLQITANRLNTIQDITTTSNVEFNQTTSNNVYTDNIYEKTPANDIHINNDVDLVTNDIKNVTNTTTNNVYTDNIYEKTALNDVHVNNDVDLVTNDIKNVTNTNTTSLNTDTINEKSTNLLIDNTTENITIQTLDTKELTLNSQNIKIKSNVPIAAQTYTLGIDATNKIVKHTPAVHTASYPLELVADDIQLKYNTTNLKLTANELNTIQDISTASDPTFNDLTITSLSSVGGNNVPIIIYHRIEADSLGAAADRYIGVQSNPWLQSYIDTMFTDQIGVLTPAGTLTMSSLLKFTAVVAGTPTRYLGLDASDNVITMTPNLILIADLDFYGTYDIINLAELRFSSVFSTGVVTDLKIDFYPSTPDKYGIGITSGKMNYVSESFHDFYDDLAGGTLLCSFQYSDHVFNIQGLEILRINASGISVSNGNIIMNSNDITELEKSTYTLTAGGGINKIDLYNNQYGFGVDANQITYVSAVNHIFYDATYLTALISNAASQFYTNSVLQFQTTTNGCEVRNGALRMNDLAIQFDNITNNQYIVNVSGEMIYNSTDNHKLKIALATVMTINATGIICDQPLLMNGNYITNANYIDFGSSVSVKSYWYSNSFYTSIEASTLRHEVATGSKHKFTVNGVETCYINSAGIYSNNYNIDAGTGNVSGNNIYLNNMYGGAGFFSIHHPYYYNNSNFTVLHTWGLGLDGTNQVTRTTSDRRFKKNIREITYDEALEKLDMQICKYEFKTPEEIQEDRKSQPVERQNDDVYTKELTGQCCGDEFIGVVLDEEPNYIKRGSLESAYSPDYLSAVPLLIKVVNEQAKLIKSLSERISALENR